MIYMLLEETVGTADNNTDVDVDAILQKYY